MGREEMLMHPEEYRVMFETEDRYWWYRGLRALVQSEVARYSPRSAHSPRPAMILDAGCGTGANLQLLQAHGHAIGVDISEEAIAFCRARGIPKERALMASITELPFPKDYFDLAVSFDVICNIPNDGQAFCELGRVVKPGGRLITQLPAHQWLWSTHDVAVGHQRRYSARDLRMKAEQAGFAVERLTHTNALFFPLMAAQRIARRHELNNGHVRSDLTTPLPTWINNMLSALAVAEMRTISHLDSPIGLSILVVARKR